MAKQIANLISKNADIAAEVTKNADIAAEVTKNADIAAAASTALAVEVTKNELQMTANKDDIDAKLGDVSLLADTVEQRHLIDGKITFTSVILANAAAAAVSSKTNRLKVDAIIGKVENDYTTTNDLNIGDYAKKTELS